MTNQTNRSPKSQLAAFLLLAFFGPFGFHRFYVGKFLTGLLYVVTLGFLGFGVLIDFLLIVCGAFTDRDGRVLRGDGRAIAVLIFLPIVLPLAIAGLIFGGSMLLGGNVSRISYRDGAFKIEAEKTANETANQPGETTAQEAVEAASAASVESAPPTAVTAGDNSGGQPQEAGYTTIFQGLERTLQAQDSNEARALAASTADTIAQYVTATRAYGNTGTMPVTAEKLLFQDLRQAGLRGDASQALILSRSGELVRVQSSIVFVQGRIDISYADDSVIVATGGITVSHGNNNVLLAGHYIDVASDGETLDFPRPDGQPRAKQARTLAASGNVVSISHANGTYVIAPDVDMSFANGVTLVNAETVSISHKDKTQVVRYTALAHPRHALTDPIGGQTLSLCRGGSEQSFMARLPEERAFTLTVGRPLPALPGKVTGRLAHWVPLVALKEKVIFERDGQYAAVKSVKKDGRCVSF